jgi:hypothetical protein
LAGDGDLHLLSAFTRLPREYSLNCGESGAGMVLVSLNNYGGPRAYDVRRNILPFAEQQQSFRDPSAAFL